MGNFATKGDSYTKPESDGRYPLKTAVDAGFGARYTKTESDARYPLTTNITSAFQGVDTKQRELENKINTTSSEITTSLADRYTKTEANDLYSKYALTTTVNGIVDVTNRALGDRYIKTESDARYPALAAYNTDKTNVNNALTARYTKTESDARYPALATYNAAVNDRYTKTESDARYPALALYNTDKTNVNNALAARYTKTESDARYPGITLYNTDKTNINNALAARYTKTESDTRINSLVSTNTLNDLKPRTMWCADGELCTVPVGKKGFTNGRITLTDNTIRNDGAGEAGRVHISGNELLYLLNKNGVIVGREWGGNGNLTVQGALIVQGRDIIAELNDLRANVIRKDVKYGVRSARGGYLSDQGGWKGRPGAAGDWEVMTFDQLPF